MFISFLSQVAPIFYISWLILFVARIISNYHIYYIIGKEEFQGSQFELSHRYSDNLLAIFTFRWSRSYMEDEDPEVIRLMRISNVLHLSFIVLSVVAAAIWLCLHGRN
jgi:hypothetical protein